MVEVERDTGIVTNVFVKCVHQMESCEHCRVEIFTVRKMATSGYLIIAALMLLWPMQYWISIT